MTLFSCFNKNSDKFKKIKKSITNYDKIIIPESHKFIKMISYNVDISYSINCSNSIKKIVDYIFLKNCNIDNDIICLQGINDVRVLYEFKKEIKKKVGLLYNISPNLDKLYIDDDDLIIDIDNTFDDLISQIQQKSNMRRDSNSSNFSNNSNYNNTYLHNSIHIPNIKNLTVQIPIHKNNNNISYTPIHLNKLNNIGSPLHTPTHLNNIGSSPYTPTHLNNIGSSPHTPTHLNNSLNKNYNFKKLNTNSPIGEFIDIHNIIISKYPILNSFHEKISNDNYDKLYGKQYLTGCNILINNTIINVYSFSLTKDIQSISVDNSIIRSLEIFNVFDIISGNSLYISQNFSQYSFYNVHLLSCNLNIPYTKNYSSTNEIIRILSEYSCMDIYKYIQKHNLTQKKKINNSNKNSYILFPLNKHNFNNNFLIKQKCINIEDKYKLLNIIHRKYNIYFFNIEYRIDIKYRHQVPIECIFLLKYK